MLLGNQWLRRCPWDSALTTTTSLLSSSQSFISSFSALIAPLLFISFELLAGSPLLLFDHLAFGVRASTAVAPTLSHVLSSQCKPTFNTLSLATFDSMPSRTLTAVWAGLDFALLAAGIISIVFSIVWRNSSVLMNFILFEIDLTGIYACVVKCLGNRELTTVPCTAGLILGIMFEISFFISLFAITQRRPLTSGLKILNWSLVLNSIGVLIIGSIIWFYSLRQPTNYQRVWLKQTTQTQIALQDQVMMLPSYTQNSPTVLH